MKFFTAGALVNQLEGTVKSEILLQGKFAYDRIKKGVRNQKNLAVENRFIFHRSVSPLGTVSLIPQRLFLWLASRRFH
ncbi:hypothetical protein Pan161_25260 [Gimesia algae]|uniref:Uncharacterized protein n=1 Tax=Gimesia algae TaxID=2527971 RepID=A0A517VCZ4_9PLAN|nr:hypothetical protein Pan161_25260 [Gimesia algae]